MEVPINKFLANDYRNELAVPDAPSFIDSRVPVQPVVVVNNGLPKPTTRQRLRYATVNANNANTYFQIATPTASTKIFFLGYYFSATSAVVSNIVIFDASSGNIPTLTNNTLFADNAGTLVYNYNAATAGVTHNFISPLPVQLANGLRMYFSEGVGNATITIYYIEEQV